jgi:ectoine hydroxylase-related dioxygenase (phytanoyl-CoA dioxygenase family)
MARLDSMEIDLETARVQGYLFVSGCVDSALAWKLRARVLEICVERGWTQPQFRGFGYEGAEFLQMQQLVACLPEFATLRASMRVKAILRQLLGTDIVDKQGDVCRVFFPGATAFATRAHQDQFFLRRAEEIWSVWIPLGDCPREMGPLGVWPGSHRLGLLPHEGESGSERAAAQADWQDFDFTCGDALFVHKLTVHRALANTSPTTRVSVDFRYAKAPS